MSVLASVKQCDKSLYEQIAVVAEFYAHKIRAERISYRTGIDLGLIQKLIKGEYEAKRFQYFLKQSRIDRRNRRLNSSMKKTGAVRRSIEQRIETDY